jgi:hypothetical protein
MFVKRLSIILLFASLAVSCGRHIPLTEPGQPGVYHSLNVKLNIKLHQEKRKGSGKIIWFYHRDRGKMLFLSPLNQVYFELLVEGERALLISRKEKKFWSGSFSGLLHRLWNIDVPYSQLLALVSEGTIPQTHHQKPLVFNIEKAQDDGQPSRIEISNDDVCLKLKISRKKTRQGLLKFAPNLESLQRVGIEEILELQY